MLRHCLVACCLLSINSAFANLIEINTSNWLVTGDPIDGIESGKWVGRGRNEPEKKGNSSGSLISDFVLSSNFTFSGTFSPTYANNGGCTHSNDNSCNDDDILGVVFGWQDADNNYRFSWNQGGMHDAAGHGLSLIKEVDGESLVLQHWGDAFWQEQQSYQFTINRKGNVYSGQIAGLVRDTLGTQNAFAIETIEGGKDESFDFSFSDDSFLTGKVGIFTRSQTAAFSEFVVNVSAPGGLVLFLTAGAMLGARRRGLIHQ